MDNDRTTINSSSHHWSIRSLWNWGCPKCGMMLGQSMTVMVNLLRVNGLFWIYLDRKQQFGANGFYPQLHNIKHLLEFTSSKMVNFGEELNPQNSVDCLRETSWNHGASRGSNSERFRILPNIGGWRSVHLENRGFTRNWWFVGELTNQKCGLFRLKQVVFTWNDGKQNGLKQQNSCMCCHQKKMVHSAKPHQKDCKVGKVGWCAHAFMDYWHWVENHQKMCVSGHLL